MNKRNITVEMPIQSVITYMISTSKSDEEIIEDIEKFVGDFHLRCPDYDIEDVTSDIEDENYDDRNSTIVTDWDNETLIYEHDPNYNG
jgi:hypothetical protein